jgi:hypothetical protein
MTKNMSDLRVELELDVLNNLDRIGSLLETSTPDEQYAAMQEMVEELNQFIAITGLLEQGETEVTQWD